MREIQIELIKMTEKIIIVDTKQRKGNCDGGKQLKIETVMSGKIL